MSRGPVFFLVVLLGPAVLHAMPADSLSGPTVREVLLRGNHTTKPEVILREMSLRRGAIATANAVEHDRQQIYNLQIFNRVDVDVHELGDSADVYVTVDERWYIFPYPIFAFRHRDTKKLIYGGGLAHQNVAGLNQKFFVEGTLGYDQSLSGRFQNPRFLGSEDIAFGVNGGYFHQHALASSGSGEYLQEVAIAGVSFGRRYGFFRSLSAGIGVEYWNVAAGTTRRTVSASGRDLFIDASVSFVDDRRDDHEYPMEGSFFSAYLAKDGFGESQVNLTRAGFDVRRYEPVVADWSLTGRLFGRWVTGGVVPTYRHVFFGYDERLRGSFATVREGEDQVGGSVELRIPLLSPRYFESSVIPVRQFSVLRYGLSMGVFVDGGKVWYRTQSLERAPLFGGTGFGLHFLLPYGIVIRMEYGVDLTAGSEFVLDFGASF